MVSELLRQREKETKSGKYTVGEILGERFQDDGHGNVKLYYLVLWKYFPKSQATWEPQENLESTAEVMKAWAKKKLDIGVPITEVPHRGRKRTESPVKASPARPTGSRRPVSPMKPAAKIETRAITRATPRIPSPEFTSPSTWLKSFACNNLFSTKDLEAEVEPPKGYLKPARGVKDRIPTTRPVDYGIEDGIYRRGSFYTGYPEPWTMEDYVGCFPFAIIAFVVICLILHQFYPTTN